MRAPQRRPGLVYREGVPGHSGTSMTTIDTISTPRSKLSAVSRRLPPNPMYPVPAATRQPRGARAARAAQALAAALASSAIPMACRAESDGFGELNGPGRIAIFALAGGWLLLTLFLFTMLRRVRPHTRYAASGLFLAAPFLWLAVTYSWFAMTEPREFTPSATATAMHTTDTPVELGGATFPAGSRVAMLAPDEHGDAPQPAAVEADRPVALGALSIRAIHRVAGGADDTYGALLAFDQTIDGWPCAAISDMDTVLRVVDRRAPKPRLVSCQLARTVTIGSVAWPPATVVRRGRKGSWTLFWQASTFSQVERAKAFSFDVDSMSGDYGAAHQLLSWSGTLHGDGEVSVADVRFGGDPAPALAWQSDGAIRVTGRGVDASGAPVNCVTVRMTRTGPAYRHCAAPAADQPASAAQGASR
ncbi:hypothetical protein EFP18_20115 [Burkholderia glumae]|nr:hypothetical protein GAS18_20435 [Burkholderia glumae]RQZ71832.1 hypothetical protein DF052_18385 [Burkholderia glumae]UVS86476.1 hypothetical protein EFP18_20115 [Burkholderia glumae]